MRKVQTFVLSLLIFGQAFGQCPEAASTCEKLLQGGLYSFTGMTNTGSFSQDLRTYYLSEQFKTDMKNGKWGGSLTVPIKGNPFTLNANDSEEKFSEFKSLILSETNLNIKSDYYQTTFSSIPNTNLYEAFNQCVQTVCSENAVGFLPVKELVSEDFVVFTLYYRPQISTDGMPKVQFFKVENASMVSNPLTVGQTLSQTTIISAKREPEKDLILTLQTDRGTVSRKIDAENSLATNKELPIGTIITSFLPFDQFNYTSKNNAKSPGELWTAQKSKWAPCDGRSVSNSGFAKVTSKTFVPDLRGMFLRGLNTFDPSNGPAPRNPNEADPETRIVGQYQADAFQGHRHNQDGDGAPGIVGGRQGEGAFVRGAEIKYLNAKAFRVLDPITDNSNGIPKISAETRPKNVTVYYYIKIN